MNTDHEFIELRRFADQDFEDLFEGAYRSYIDGDWEAAGAGFAELLELRPNDGPTKNLNKVINIVRHRKAPQDWKGYRPLTSK